MECTGWGIGGGQGAVSGVHRVGPLIVMPSPQT